MPADSPEFGAGNLLLRAVGLTKTYRQGSWFSKTAREIDALRSVDLNLRAGSTLGLIGGSGSGKSTLAHCLSSIERPDAGEIWFAGENIARCDRKLLPLKCQIQTIFQDAGSSLNPRLAAIELVSEPLLIAGQARKHRQDRAMELIELVGLPPGSQQRLAFEFSAGQRRRLAIARALALQPKVLILDESLAGLDLSMQAQISNLLLELQAACSLAYIFISHDLNLVAQFADEIAVMDHGRIVEFLSTAQLLEDPRSRAALHLREASSKISFRAGAR